MKRAGSLMKTAGFFKVYERTGTADLLRFWNFFKELEVGGAL